jgi:hypothetical protein
LGRHRRREQQQKEDGGAETCVPAWHAPSTPYVTVPSLRHAYHAGGKNEKGGPGAAPIETAVTTRQPFSARQ